ncbi:hypothetical protein DJ69_13465 [Halorubrum persicum]|uniref:Uncharacterized protein n=1 Tax=Halorubrum persicum TaxID=1383844 RepID=A0A2G1WGK5_9EURY|nr:hypothetical protein DJ69_13465 [Halorubrum persicum]
MSVITLSDELEEYKIDKRELDNLRDDVKKYDDVKGIVENPDEDTISLIIDMSEFEPEVELRYYH